MDIASVLSGIGAGVAYSLTSFSKKEGQDFDFKKFGFTLVIGGVAGAASGAFGADLNASVQFLVNAGAVSVLENILKAFKRKILPRIKQFMINIGAI